jgi:hypothetical protein
LDARAGTQPPAGCYARDGEGAGEVCAGARRALVLLVWSSNMNMRRCTRLSKTLEFPKMRVVLLQP